MNVKGFVLNHRYQVEDLQTERQFRVSASLKACFEATDDEKCLIDVVIFNNTLVPKMICNWTEGLSTASMKY